MFAVDVKQQYNNNACTGDNLLAKARVLSPRADGKTMVKFYIYSINKTVFIGPAADQQK